DQHYWRPEAAGGFSRPQMPVEEGDEDRQEHEADGDDPHGQLGLLVMVDVVGGDRLRRVGHLCAAIAEHKEADDERRDEDDPAERGEALGVHRYTLLSLVWLRQPPSARAYTRYVPKWGSCSSLLRHHGDRVEQIVDTSPTRRCWRALRPLGLAMDCRPSSEADPLHPSVRSSRWRWGSRSGLGADRTDPGSPPGTSR